MGELKQIVQLIKERFSELEEIKTLEVGDEVYATSNGLYGQFLGLTPRGKARVQFRSCSGELITYRDCRGKIVPYIYPYYYPNVLRKVKGGKK